MSDDTTKPDLDLDEQEDNEQDVIKTPFDPKAVDIINKPFTISKLLQRLKYQELKLTPDFQRRANLWGEDRKSRLIESILLHIPLPSFYFSEDSEGNYEVVDGLQRLCAIFHFIDYQELNNQTNANPKLSELKLCGLQYLSEKDSLSFQELDRRSQRTIEELEINVNIIRASTPKEVMFNVFARLNQGGLPLSAQEIRNAIYLGRWRDEIREMAQSLQFKQATNGKIPTDRQQDMEMVLRFVALWALKEPHSRPSNQVLDKFLNDCVDDKQKTQTNGNISNWGNTEWKRVKDQFYKGLKAATDIFGQHAFRKSHGRLNKSPINKGLFESQLITLCNRTSDEIDFLVKNKKQVCQIFGEKMSDYGSRLNSSLRSGTGHAEASNNRISELNNIFNEVIKNANKN